MVYKKLYFTDYDLVEKKDFKTNDYFIFCNEDVINNHDEGEIVYEVEFNRVLDLGSVYNPEIEEFIMNWVTVWDDSYEHIDYFLAEFDTLNKKYQRRMIDNVIDEFDLDGLTQAPYYSVESGSLENNGVMIFYPYGLIKSVKRIN